MLPMEIEKRSFEIIAQELPHPVDESLAPVVLRVIHATADFDYADSLYFSDGAVDAALAALRGGATIVTDTTMALAGINKPALERHGCAARCFIADADVAEAARRQGATRSAAAVEKAAALEGPLVFAIGNAPTALLSICSLVNAGILHPAVIIGVPVGFVNVAEAKEDVMRLPVPFIVARGRKGGSNVAAAIVNAAVYQLCEREE